MKKILIIFIILLVPVLTFVEVWGVKQYQQLEDEIRDLEKDQVLRLEANKKVLAMIAQYSSPGRLDDLAQKELNLQRLEGKDVQKINFDQGGGF